MGQAIPTPMLAEVSALAERLSAWAPRQTSRLYAHLAKHDHLARLPNQALLAEQLVRSLDQATGAPAVALLFIDLDRFKVINDSLGHDAGDTLLCEVAVRLRRAIRLSDLAARL